MGVAANRVAGVALVFAGLFVLLLVADLLFIAEVVWRPSEVAFTVLLAAIGAGAIAYGCRRFAATYN